MTQSHHIIELSRFAVNEINAMREKTWKPILSEEWYDNYCPIPNPIDEDACFDGTKFETYGAELQQVQSADHSHVWTLVDEDGRLMIFSGYWTVNRIGYFITEHPWTGETYVDTE